MICQSSVQFRVVFGVFGLLLIAGCQGPGAPDSRPRLWAGTAQVRDTDFDRRTWHGTTADTVRRLMERLPDRIESAAQHRLARNLLVSVADAPQGAEDSAALLSLRVDALMRYGEYADAASLARAGRNLPRDPASAEREAEAELLAGNIEMACIDLRALAARSSGEWSSAGWVEEGVALCKARAGDAGTVPPPDAGHRGALARIRGGALSAEPPSGEPPGTRTAYLAAVAADTKIPAARRLEAAFQAARANAIGAGAYAKLLRSAPGRGSAGAGPPATGEQAAALFQATLRAPDAAHRLALAEQGLLSPGGAVDGVGAALAEALRGLRPDGALAGRYAAYFYAVGDIKAAASLADRAKRADTAIWPYRALVKPPAAGELAEWEKRAALDPGRRARMAAILSAFGIGAEPAGEGADEGDLRELDAAATAQRAGETTLRALAILGRGGPAAASPQALHHVLKALDRVAQHDEARALAFEAMAATLKGQAGA
jgi:tetratricopeptide (TPR) repeat protein